MTGLVSRLRASLTEATRFFLVSVAGLSVDVGLAWALIALVSASDPVAVAAGFATATVANYFAHQFWTFPSGPRAASLRRFLGFCAVVAVTFGVRLTALALLADVFPGSGVEAPIRLGLAAGTSFLVAFPLSRFLVFSESRT